MNQSFEYETQPNTDHTEGGRVKDPGSPLSGVLALIFAVVFAGGVILWQNLPEDTQYALINETKAETLVSADTPAPGRFGSVDIVARMFIRGHEMLTQSGDESAQMVMQQLAAAQSPEDQVRAIIMSGEFESDEAALQRVEALRLELQAQRADDSASNADGGLDEGAFDTLAKNKARRELVLAELAAIEKAYTDGVDSIDQPMRDQLVARYGVLGHAVLTHGMDPSDPAREPIVTGFGWMAGLLFAMGALVLVSFLVGLVLLIIGIINLASGKMKLRFEAPAPGGSVFLETYALFVGAFGLMSIGLFVLSEKVNPALAILGLPLQWLLMAITLWALVRGMRVRDWRKAIGLHTGEGLFKEIACGALVYLASIPIFFVGVLITILVVMIQAGIASSKGVIPEEPTNPIFDMLSSGNPLMIVLIFTLATIWAPITEELIFRGALFRHLSGRLYWVLAALVSGVLFAYMHSYGPLMVAPLIALGFMFAFMRQWRGSIIPCMTAHFMHNATLMVFMILFIGLLKDPVI